MLYIKIKYPSCYLYLVIELGGCNSTQCGRPSTETSEQVCTVGKLERQASHRYINKSSVAALGSAFFNLSDIPSDFLIRQTFLFKASNISCLWVW